jgi:hypothetical protein
VYTNNLKLSIAILVTINKLLQFVFKCANYRLQYKIVDKKIHELHYIYAGVFMPIQIICPRCTPVISKSLNEETEIEEETITFTTFDNWQAYAGHILKEHPRDLRAIWAKNSLEQMKLKVPEVVEAKSESVKKITAAKVVARKPVPVKKLTLLEKIANRIIKPKKTEVQQKVQAQVQPKAKVKIVPTVKQLEAELETIDEPENPEEVISKLPDPKKKR